MKSRLALFVLILAACTQTPQKPAVNPVAATPAVPAVSATAAAAPATAETVRRYDFLMGAGKAGEETVSVNGTTRTAHFEFNDRGRGPKIDSTIETNSRLIPLSITSKGNDYYKAAVEETFANGTWSSNAEKGSSANHDAVYVSMNGTPEEGGILAKALLAAPDHKLPLLPAGEATIRKLGDTTVEHDGHRQHVTCYAVTGLDFTPSLLWLDDANEMFASVSSWSSIIREGWGKETAQKLIDAQKTWSDADALKRTARLTHKPGSGAILVTNARLFDPATKTSTPGMSILVHGNKIERIGSDGSIHPAYPTEIIDAKGRSVLPGLWNMHKHMSEDQGLLDIANGVTSARDLGNDVDTVVELKKKWGADEAIGPRLILAALIDGTSPYTGPTKLIVDSEDDFRKVIDKVAPLGFEQTKIYSSIKPELVPFIAKTSHDRGLRVSGHIPSGMYADDAVRAGYDEIQHANFLFLNFFRDVKETRTPQRFTSVAERAATLDLNSPEVRAFIELLKEHKTVSDPTVSIFEEMFTSRRGEISPGYVTVADRLPSQVRRGFLSGGLPVPDGMDQRYKDSFRKMLALVKLMHDNGITIVAGTDSMPGFALHRELELYVQAGIPAPEVLRIATLGAATVMHRADTLGSIEPGKLADLIIVDGDPATNISDIRKVVTVVKDGLIYQPAEIDRELGIKP